MFFLSKIDTFVIVYIQWVVRQFELYTKYTRRNVVDTTVNAVGTIILLWIIVIPTGLLLGASFVACILLLFSWPSARNSFLLIKETSKKEPDSDKLPDEILNRRKERVVALMCAIVILIMYPFFIPSIIRYGIIDFVVISLASFYFIVSAILEYLLCTKSIQPYKKHYSVVD